MRLKKYFAAFLAVAMLIACMTVGAVGSTVSLKLSSDADGLTEVSLGDTVTYTVSLTESSGIVGGTLYFRASDTLEYVSAELLSADFSAKPVHSGEYAGCYAVYFMGDKLITENNSLCRITFRVVGDGQIGLELIPYQMTDGESFAEASVDGSPLLISVKELTKPEITSSSPPEAVMGYSFSYKFVGTDPDFLTFSYEGDLPQGITLKNDGTLSGTPTEYGEFRFTVTARLLDRLDSDPVSVTLTVLEKPRKLELTEESTCTIDDDGYLNGLKEKQNVESLLSHFKNSERIKVFDSSGKEVTGSKYIGTGFTVSLMHGDEKVHTVTVVVMGDVSGNGRIDGPDYQLVQLHISGTRALEGAFLRSARVSGRDNVRPGDYQLIQLHIMGSRNLFE